MDRRDQYLSVIWDLVTKICPPPLVRRVTKIVWLDEGLSIFSSKAETETKMAIKMLRTAFLLCGADYKYRVKRRHQMIFSKSSD